MNLLTLAAETLRLDWSALVQALITLATLLLAYVALRLRALVAERIKNDTARSMFQRAYDQAVIEVRAAAQVTVPKILAAAADGRLSEKEAADLKAMVIHRVKTSLGVVGLAALDRATGSRPVDEVLGSMVEAAVFEAKHEGPAEPPAAPREKVGQ